MMLQTANAPVAAVKVGAEYQWMQQVASGDAEAFGRMVEEYRRLVAMIAFRLIRSEADREEISQEVFLKIYQNASMFRGEAKISTWIGRVAYNTCLNHLRKRKEISWSEFAGPDVSLETVAGTAPTPETVAESDYMIERMEREMVRLDPGDRTILTLFHLSGMSYEDIGRVMDLPAGTVKSQLFRARKKLRERISANAGKEEA